MNRQNEQFSLTKTVRPSFLVHGKKSATKLNTYRFDTKKKTQNFFEALSDVLR